MWKLTVDFYPDREAAEGTNLNAVGIASGDYDQARDAEMTEKFRMYDDDGAAYYEGVATPESDFEPLDDFGEGNAGCVEIRYLRDGEWLLL